MPNPPPSSGKQTPFGNLTPHKALSDMLLEERHPPQWGWGMSSPEGVTNPHWHSRYMTQASLQHSKQKLQKCEGLKYRCGICPLFSKIMPWTLPDDEIILMVRRLMAKSPKQLQDRDFHTLTGKRLTPILPERRKGLKVYSWPVM